MPKKQVDLVIIGGGPAGYNAAEQAAAAGLSTVVIEKRAMGGVCLNEGCIPTKALLYSAKVYDYAKHGSDYGVNFGEATLDHATVIKLKNKSVKKLVAGVKNRVSQAGAEIITGEAIIQGRENGMTMIAAGENVFAAKFLLIASGSSAALPPIQGLKEQLDAGFALTNREILDLTVLPASLVVIGGGVIGLEMAQYFAIAGSKVTVVEALDHIAGQNDADIVALLQKNFEKLGVDFHLNSRVTAFESGKVLFDDAEGKQQSLPCDKVLVSIGRRPNTDGLGLESIGVAIERGAIITDAQMKTNVSGVFAAGDVNGKSMLAHTGYREGEVALNNMLGKRDTMHYDAIPAAVYTNPEIGAVGETKATALEKGLHAKEVAISMMYSGRYMVENPKGNGICKLVFDADTDRIIGAHAYSNYASEFIVAAGEAIEIGLTASDMMKIVFPHPSVCEIMREALLEYLHHKK